MNDNIRKMKRGLKSIRRNLISGTRNRGIDVYKSYSLSNCFMSVGDIDFYLYWMKSNSDDIDPEFMRMVISHDEKTLK